MHQINLVLWLDTPLPHAYQQMSTESFEVGGLILMKYETKAQVQVHSCLPVGSNRQPHVLINNRTVLEKCMR